VNLFSLQRFLCDSPVQQAEIRVAFCDAKNWRNFLLFSSHDRACAGNDWDDDERSYRCARRQLLQCVLHSKLLLFLDIFGVFLRFTSAFSPRKVQKLCLPMENSIENVGRLMP
jgi:hypothetical protein